MKKFRRKCWKGKLRAHSLASLSQACQTKRPMPTSGRMKLVAISIATVFLGFSLSPVASAQTPPPEPSRSSDAVQLEALAKKIDEQNAKIDALSQQILKLEEQISHVRPGVMIGESTPSAVNPATPAESTSRAMGGNSHTVARGETLTSIAKMYKVGVEELQNFNHIEDGRKLQAGQTIMIPASPSPAPSASPSAGD
jgi:LysM repeat protein